MAEVVHQDDVSEQMWRGAVDDAVHSAKQNGQSLVMKTDDDAGGGEVFGVKLVLLSAPAMELLIQHIWRQAIDHFHIDVIAAMLEDDNKRFLISFCC